MARASSLDRKVHDLVHRRLQHAQLYWQNDNEMYGRLLDFCLFLNHYRNDPGLTRDKRRIQPKTQRQFNLIRHKASLLLRQMPQFDTHAVQPGADAHAAEASRRVIENIFNDPLKAYHDPRSRMVWSALSAGRGVIAIEWHPKWGVCFSFRDPRRVHIEPGQTFMHSVFNGVVFEEVPMRMSQLRSMPGWDIPDDLEGDGGIFENSVSGDREADGIERDAASHLPGSDEEDRDDPVVTICKAHFREDPYKKRPSKLVNADLPEDEWHFVDDATQMKVPFDPMNPVPPVSEATGAPLRLVTRKSEMNTYDEGEDGYLIVIAPHYHGRKPLYEGGWTDGALNPNAKLSAFPYMELGCYKHPLKRTGLSDTEATHSLTIVDNASFRATFEQMKQAGGILITESGALEDSEGNQFKFSDEPIAIAYAKDRLSLESTNFFQAPGMNAAMPAFRNMIEQQWQHIGTGDFAGALGPDRSKDIAVGTANLLQQSGDLPVQLHAQDLSLQEAIGARVALDYCRAYMGDNVVSWVTDEGDPAYATVRGEDLVPLNVAVRADSQWTQQDVDRVQAMAQFLGQVAPMGLPPPVLAVLLKEARFSVNAVNALIGAMQPPAMPAPGQGPPDLSVVPGGGGQPQG
jgi:hypothetical protein